MAKRLIVIVVVALLLVSILWSSQQRSSESVVSGIIEADELRLGSRVGGRVARILVEEGQTVQRGELLVELEPFDWHERRAQAAATLAQRQSELDELQAGFRTEEIAQGRARLNQLQANFEKLKNGSRPQEIKAAEADLELAAAEFELAKMVLNRTESLLAKNATTREAFDEAATKLRVAQARQQTAAERLDLLKAGTRTEDIHQAEAQLEEAQHSLELLESGYRTEDIRQAESAVAAADAALKAIDRQIAELSIVAPADGVIDATDLQPGELVGANVPVISLIDMSHLWVRAYVPENRLDIKTGQSVDVAVDSFPGETFQGTVTFVSREAEFTPRNVQTIEERSKQVFRIKVKLDRGSNALRPGMNADVWLNQEQQSHE